jgi:flagellar biosynthesis/type III secretory pathway chaperone
MKTDEILDQLLGVLNQETELYQAMSTVMNKEKDAAIKSELIALNEAGIEKENILVALGFLEDQRRDLVTNLADIFGYCPQDLNLTAISQLVGEPYAGRLKQTSANLSTLLETLQDANQRNRQLFEHSLGLLRGSFNLLSELRASSPVYYSTGVLQSTHAAGRCVSDEI